MQHAKQMAGARGQASAELVAIVPLILFGALALVQVALAAWALLGAGEAARAAARAEHVGADAQRAAAEALPFGLDSPEVKSDGSAVTVALDAPAVVPGVPAIPVEASASLDPGGS